MNWSSSVLPFSIPSTVNLSLQQRPGPLWGIRPRALGRFWRGTQSLSRLGATLASRQASKQVQNWGKSGQNWKKTIHLGKTEVWKNFIKQSYKPTTLIYSPYQIIKQLLHSKILSHPFMSFFSCGLLLRPFGSSLGPICQAFRFADQSGQALWANSWSIWSLVWWGFN